MMKLLDATLREGAQRFGVYLKPEVKLRLALLLYDIGIEEIELGIVRKDKDLEYIWRAIRKEKVEDKFSFWCRLNEKDLELAHTLFPGLTRINLSAPASKLHIKYKLKITPEELLKRIRKLVEEATQYFSYISLGLEDASRTSPSFLYQIAEEASAAGVRRLRLSDTLSFWQPLKVIKLVEEFKKRFPNLELSFHFHNDLGLATGNAVTALETGADWVDVSLLGLGERAGITPLEEVLAYLYFRRGEKHYRLELLPLAAHFLSWHAGETISPFKPVLGRYLFTCETGLHVDGLYKKKKLYEPFPPEVLGLSHKLVLGEKSGLGALKGKLKELGLTISEEYLPILLNKIRSLAQKYGRPLSDEEIKKIYEQFAVKNKSEEVDKIDFSTKLTNA
ncbi:LeuA family protein [Thermodesulfatator indicus]